jgi:hypothetical protein
MVRLKEKRDRPPRERPTKGEMSESRRDYKLSGLLFRRQHEKAEMGSAQMGSEPYFV